MRMVDILQKKRHGAALTAEEIRFFVQGCTDGTLPDYQLSAMLMAICCCGMDAGETAVLTEAMAHSGDTVDLSRFGDRSVDKHSTGGVGDKTTLIVAPLVAALGGCVAKMSGRGLGHTGGTVDKLEAIPGYRTELPAEAFLQQVERVGVAVIGQSGDLTPADKKLYALRDVTATVDSIPLITSSIMSKKLAAGSHSIVLDVKVGSGAFMKTPEQARQLAEQMVCIGRPLRAPHGCPADQYGCTARLRRGQCAGGGRGRSGAARRKPGRSAPRVRGAGGTDDRADLRLLPAGGCCMQHCP